MSDQRLPLVCVVPVTGTKGEGALYPVLQAGSIGLSKTSYASIDHLRSMDKRRLRRVFAQLSRPEMDAIDERLALFLGLAERFGPPPAPGQ